MNSRNNLGTRKQTRRTSTKSSTKTTTATSTSSSSSSSPSPPMPTRQWNFVQVSGSKKTRGKRKRPAWSPFLRDWIIESARAPATPITSITTTVITTSLADPNAPLPEDLLTPPETPPSLQRSGRTCGASRRTRMLHSLEPRTWTPAELQWFVMADSPKRTRTTTSPPSSNSPPSSSSELSYSEPILPPTVLYHQPSSIDNSVHQHPQQQQQQFFPTPSIETEHHQSGYIFELASIPESPSIRQASTRLLPAISASHIYEETLIPAFPATPSFSTSYHQQSTTLQNLVLFGEEQESESSE